MPAFLGLDQMISDIPDADLFTGKADILSKIGNVSLNTGCVDDIDFPVAVHVAAIKSISIRASVVWGAVV